MISRHLRPRAPNSIGQTPRSMSDSNIFNQNDKRSAQSLVSQVAQLFDVDDHQGQTTQIATKDQLMLRSKDDLIQSLLQKEADLKLKQYDLDVAAVVGKQLLSQIEDLQHSQSSSQSDYFQSNGEYSLTLVDDFTHKDEIKPLANVARLETLRDENQKLLLKIETMQAEHAQDEEIGLRELTLRSKEIQTLRTELDSLTKELIESKAAPASPRDSGKSSKVTLIGRMRRKSSLVVQSAMSKIGAKSDKDLQNTVENATASDFNDSPGDSGHASRSFSDFIGTNRSSMRNSRIFSTPEKSQFLDMSERESILVKTLNEKILQLNKENTKINVELDCKMAEMEQYKRQWLEIHRESNYTRSPKMERARKKLKRKNVDFRKSDQGISDAASFEIMDNTNACIDKKIEHVFLGNDIDNGNESAAKILSELLVETATSTPHTDQHTLNAKLTPEFGPDWIEQLVEFEASRSFEVNKDISESIGQTGQVTGKGELHKSSSSRHDQAEPAHALISMFFRPLALANTVLSFWIEVFLWAKMLLFLAFSAVHMIRQGPRSVLGHS